jgi:hypothetical protein
MLAAKTIINVIPQVIVKPSYVSVRVYTLTLWGCGVGGYGCGV